MDRPTYNLPRLLGDRVFACGQQAWHYEAHFEFPVPPSARVDRIEATAVLRVRIHRGNSDAYTHGAVDVYDPAGRVWNELARIMADQMAVCGDWPGGQGPGGLRGNRVSYTHRREQFDETAFYEDEGALFDKAALILNVLGARS